MLKLLLGAAALFAFAIDANAERVVASAADLQSAIADANAGTGDTDIVVAPGTYTLTSQYGLGIYTDGVTVRGQSAARGAVVIEGAGMSNSAITHIFQIVADDVVIENLTIGWVGNHAIQVHGESPHDADRCVIRNVHFRDTGEQMLKVSYVEGDAAVSEGGLVEDCSFEFTAGIGPQYYIGGIDAHAARDWIVRNNEFRGIRSPGGTLAEHAIHFWSDAANTLVEGNVIVNCDRGIGFGLGSRGHSGGIIRNNMIYHADLGDFGDVSIELESAPGAEVYHNTIVQEHSFPAAISVRFGASSGVEVDNNLIRLNGSNPIWFRDGGSATLANNVTNAEMGWFVAPTDGNLRLSGDTVPAVDAGSTRPGATSDIDGDARPSGSAPDVGADEYQGAASSIEPGSWAGTKALFRG